jgi:hypothetical protein
MRRPLEPAPDKWMRDHLRVRQTTQMDARGHFGCLKYVAPVGDILSWIKLSYFPAKKATRIYNRLHPSQFLSRDLI